MDSAVNLSAGFVCFIGIISETLQASSQKNTKARWKTKVENEEKLNITKMDVNKYHLKHVEWGKKTHCFPVRQASK